MKATATPPAEGSPPISLRMDAPGGVAIFSTFFTADVTALEGVAAVIGALVVLAVAL